jgi:arabinofuranosyltransferase
MVKENMKAALSHPGWLLATIAFFLAFGIVVLRTAWLCDDAYITFRTVDNFINGNGLTWNISERVQAYTHPLWMFLLSAFYFFTKEIYYTSIILSVIASLLAVYFFAFHIASSRLTALLGMGIFIFSRAFVDYSTSGLENPLTHVILAIFLLIYVRSETFDSGKLFLLSMVAALGTLNRMDTFLLFLSPLAYVTWKLRSIKGLTALTLGFLPFILWECFSLFYYGFPFPNTAYAKLNTGIAAGELTIQGLHYLTNSLTEDPITLLGIASGLVVPLILRNWKLVPVTFSIILYVLYVVKVGGDFMSGRFLTAPLFCALVLLSVVHFSSKLAIVSLVMVVGIGFLSPTPPPLSGSDYGVTQDEDAMTGFKRSHGITDERRFYYQHTGLLKAFEAGQRTIWPDHEWAAEGLIMKTRGKGLYICVSTGFRGFFCGSDNHILDVMALTDPLLARLPCADARNWRIGHFERIIPEGYIETLLSGRNEIVDRNLASYYDKLTLITRGELFDGQRLRAIWNMNIGSSNQLSRRPNTGLEDHGK